MKTVAATVGVTRLPGTRPAGEPRVTMQEAMDWYLEVWCPGKGNGTATIKRRRATLRRLAGLYPDLPQTRTEILRFMASLQDKAVETRKDYLTDLRRFYRQIAFEYGVVNPTEGVESPRRKSLVRAIYSDEEIDLVLQKCECHRDRLVVLVLYDTGVRVGELASVNTHTMGEKGMLVEGKTGQRPVRVNPRLIQEMRMIAARNGDVWVGRKGRLGTSALQQIVRKAAAEAGIRGKKLGPHTLRHTYATKALARGVQIGEVQRQLGHESPKTTMSYVHMAEDLLLLERERISPADGAVEAWLGAGRDRALEALFADVRELEGALA